MATSSAPPGTLPHRVFTGRPDRSFIEAVRAHVGATGQPETCVDLHRGPIRKDEPFHKLTPIEIPRLKRPAGDKAPCPMCQPNKFLDRWLVHLFELRAAAIIGHCCAAAATKAEADREWAERQARDREESYLLEALPRLPAWLRATSLAEPACEEAQRLFRALRSDGEPFHKVLRQIRAHAGRLSVAEVMQNAFPGGPSGITTRGSTVQTRDIEFGQLDGLTVGLADYKPHRSLLQVRAALEPHVQPDDQAMINHISGHGPEHRQTTYRTLRKAARDFAAIIAGLGDLRLFFTSPNLERLGRWAAHPDSPLGFTVRMTTDNDKRAASVIFQTKRRFFHHKFGPAMWTPVADLAFEEPALDA